MSTARRALTLIAASGAALALSAAPAEAAQYYATTYGFDSLGTGTVASECTAQTVAGSSSTSFSTQLNFSASDYGDALDIWVTCTAYNAATGAQYYSKTAYGDGGSTLVAASASGTGSGGTGHAFDVDLKACVRVTTYSITKGYQTGAYHCMS